MMIRRLLLGFLALCVIVSAGFGPCSGSAAAAKSTDSQLPKGPYRVSMDLLRQAAAESVYSILPKDAVLTVRFASIQEAADQLNAFTESALGMPLGSEVEKIFTEPFDLENLNGIDKTRPVWFVLIGKEEIRKPLVTVFPLSDKDAFLAQFEVTENESGFYSTDRCKIQIGNGYGHMQIGDGYAVLNKEDLKQVVGDWATDRDKVSTLLSMDPGTQSGVSLWVEPKNLIERYREEIESAIEKIIGEIKKAPVPTPIPESNIKLIEVFAGWLMDICEQVNESRVDLHLSAEGIEVVETWQLADGSPFGNYIRNAELPDATSLYPVLTSDSWITGVMRLDPRLYALTKEAFLKGFAEAGIEMENMEEIWDLSSKAYTGGAAFDMNSGESMGNPVIQDQLMGLKDMDAAKEILDSMGDLMKASYKISIPQDVATAVVKENKEAGKHKGIPYSTLEISLDVKDPESPVAAMYKEMKIPMGYGIQGKTLAFSTGGDITQLLDILAENAKADPKAIEWLEKASDRNMVSLRINLLQMMKFIKMAAEQEMKGFNPFAMIKIPDESDNPGVTVFVNIIGENVEFRVTVPTQEINAVRMAVMAGMQPLPQQQ